MSKSILFLTTLNLASNPRLVKEMDLALKCGYAVSVICFEFNNWSKKNNDALLSKYPTVNFFIVPAGRKPLVPWLVNGLKEKLYRVLSIIFPLGIRQISQTVSRRSDILIKKINEIDHANLVIGHNPGAIYPTLLAAKKMNCPAGFDIEDYHPGEGQDTKQKKLILSLFKNALPKFDYVSFASELIKKRVESDLQMETKKWFSILNYFPSDEFVEPQNQPHGNVKFVWFSQNIKSGSGLEEFIDFFKGMSYCELHLYGNLDKNFFDEKLSKCKNIIIHQPVSQKQLHNELSNYDIGLALDIANDENRDLAITNKILAYLQSGLFVLASNISAHKYIINQHEGHGVCFTGTKNNNFLLLKSILSDIDTIRKNKNNRFYYFKKYCWETESVTLNNKWNELLS